MRYQNNSPPQMRFPALVRIVMNMLYYLRETLHAGTGFDPLPRTQGGAAGALYNFFMRFAVSFYKQKTRSLPRRSIIMAKWQRM